MQRPVALTVAGSDSSGGAGIEADLKTMTVLGVYGAVAITSITAQNTLGVTDHLHVPPELVAAQMDAVFDDLTVDSVKTGMLPTAETIEAVADRLGDRGRTALVVDPVMVATSGARLMREDAIDTMKSRLLPLADVLTPNMQEAAVLAGFDVDTREGMAAAGRAILTLGPRSVLVKGGHLEGAAADVLCVAGGVKWFETPRVGAGKVHGTGCTLSAAIASWLALGESTDDAVRRAKRYVTACIASDLGIGRGSALIDHISGAGGEEP